MIDKLKFVLVALIVVVSLGSFYYFSEQSMLLRVIGLLVALGAVITIMLQTEMGRGTWVFVQDSQIEIRKVVWPTRKETVQTTLIVMGMVIVIAIFLWLLDMFLIWAVRSITM